MSGPESDSESEPAPDDENTEQSPCEQTEYVPSDEEEFGEVSCTIICYVHIFSNHRYVVSHRLQQGEMVEELAEESKSLIWIIVKQVRPGMDLSKVVLPTFILEPRSFLDKLSDSYYHADLLSK